MVGGLVKLSKKVIDLDELRILAAQGVPDVAGVRSTVWKVLNWLAFVILLPPFPSPSSVLGRLVG
jgi:hypothetical protein